MVGSIGDLVVSAQNGDPHAMQDLYHKFLPLIRRLIRRYRHMSLAEDLPGEIYLSFVHHVRMFQPDRGIHFPHYILRMLSASVHTYVRKACLTTVRELPSAEMERHGDDTTNWSRCAADDMEAVLSRVVLSGLLDQLTPRQARVFVSRGLHEMDYNDIAARFGMSPGAARVQFHTARRRLVQHWQTQVEADS